MMDTVLVAAAEAALQEHYVALWKSYDEAFVPTELFHYSSGAGLDGILRTQTFYASDVLSFTDSSEIRHGRDLLCELLSEDASPLSRSIHEGLQAGLGLAGLGETWVANAVCFCQERDVLSQWRGYGGQSGFALGVDFGRLRARAQAIEFGILRMLYDRDKQREMLSAAINRCKEVFAEFRPESQEQADALLQKSATVLLQSIFRLKHPAFHEEKEWRAFTIDALSEAAQKTEFRWRGVDIIPYSRITFSPDLITRVVHGPGLFSPINDLSLPRLLQSLGFGHVAVERSTIPLR